MTAIRDTAGETTLVNPNPASRRSIAAALANAGIADDINRRSGELSPNAEVVLQRRYLSKNREGNVLEDADGMFRRVAHNLSQADKNYGASEAERQTTEDRFLSRDAPPGVASQLADAYERRQGIAAAFPPASCCQLKTPSTGYSTR